MIKNTDNSPTGLAIAALNGFKWLGNNLHNIKADPDLFANFYTSALEDAEKAFLALAPVDPIATGHNPEKLTVSQVGEGWRLLDRDEIKDRGKLLLEIQQSSHNGGWDDTGFLGNYAPSTYRTRLSREALAALDAPPKPCSHSIIEGIGDPRRCQKCGIELWRYYDAPYWRPGKPKNERPPDTQEPLGPLNVPKPAWSMPVAPAGPGWHCNDFTEADLPPVTDGGLPWRPLLMGEMDTAGDMFYRDFKWILNGQDGSRIAADSTGIKGFHVKHRTRRPLPSAPKLRAWTFQEAPTLLKVKSKIGGYFGVADLYSDGYNIGFSLQGACKTHSFQSFLENFTQLDGQPCGVTE